MEQINSNPSRSVSSLPDWDDLVPANEVEWHDSAAPWTYRDVEYDGDYLGIDRECLIVACDGACPGNGRPDADLMAMGAYFGPDNPNNHHWTLSTYPSQTSNQRAELLAAIWTLRRVLYLRSCFPNDGPLPAIRGLHQLPMRIMLKTDSAYLVDCMSKWLGHWRSNGFRKSDGKPVLSE